MSFTEFYPDMDLWSPQPRAWAEEEGSRGLEPIHIAHRPSEGYYVPVAICARSTQVLGVRSVATQLWDSASGIRSHA